MHGARGCPCPCSSLDFCVDIITTPSGRARCPRTEDRSGISIKVIHLECDDVARTIGRGDIDDAPDIAVVNAGQMDKLVAILPRNAASVRVTEYGDMFVTATDKPNVVVLLGGKMLTPGLETNFEIDQTLWIGVNKDYIENPELFFGLQSSE